MTRSVPPRNRRVARFSTTGLRCAAGMRAHSDLPSLWVPVQYNAAAARRRWARLSEGLVSHKRSTCMTDKTKLALAGVAKTLALRLPALVADSGHLERRFHRKPIADACW